MFARQLGSFTIGSRAPYIFVVNSVSFEEVFEKCSINRVPLI